MKKLVLILCFFLSVYSLSAQSAGGDFSIVLNEPEITAKDGSANFESGEMVSYGYGLRFGRFEIAKNFYFTQRILLSETLYFFETSALSLKLIESFVFDFVTYEKGSFYFGGGVGTGFNVTQSFFSSYEMNSFQGISAYGTFGTRYKYDSFMLYLEGTYEKGFSDQFKSDNLEAIYSAIYISAGAMIEL